MVSKGCRLREVLERELASEHLRGSMGGPRCRENTCRRAGWQRSGCVVMIG